MVKKLPCIKVNDDALDHLRDYFFNNYKGEKFPVILKGSFYIQLYVGNRYAKFLVSQESDNTVITSVDDNNNKNPISIIIHDNKFDYNYEENYFVANASVVTNIIGCEDKIEEFEKELTDLFSYLVIFFANEKDHIPYNFTCSKNKKKQKKMVREYEISKELVLNKVKLSFCDNINYEDFNLPIELKTSIHYSQKLEELMEIENISDVEPLFIPFKEFKLSFDKNITEVFCNVSESDKTLECVIFKNKLKVFALKISLEKDPNRNFKIFTFDEFKKFDTDGLSPFELAKDIIHFMVINFFYFTHYKVIIDKKEKTSKSKPANTLTDNITRERSKKSSATNQRNIYLNADKKVFDIAKAINRNTEKRKKPEYRKFSWQVRGHMRKLASGKVIYIAPYTCKRKRNGNQEGDVKRYIINV